MAAPHRAPGRPVTAHRGHFWIPGPRVVVAGGTVQQAPMFVQWEAPSNIVHPLPLVLVHGGGGQGTDWTGTPDGRPGWATRLVEAGLAVYVVDRCGHGRSPYHPAVIGAMGDQFTYQAAEELFRPSADLDLDQLVSPMGPLPADLAASQRMDAERLTRLLDITGRAVLVTHSAGGPVGWLAADARPQQVAGIAAIEPLGPPFADVPGLGELTWGLTSAEITTDPPAEGPQDVPGRRIPALADMPITVVTGGSSPFAGFAPQIVEFLRAAGADAERLDLPEHGIGGNGHGLIFEANSDATVIPVIQWILSRTKD